MSVALFILAGVGLLMILLGINSNSLAMAIIGLGILLIEVIVSIFGFTGVIPTERYSKTTVVIESTMSSPDASAIAK